MKTQTQMNIPTMKATEFIETMTPIYEAFMKNADVKLPSLMLWGSPGVGKSDAIKQIASSIALKMKRKAVVTDVRLLLYSPVDLRGIPTADENKEFCKWLKPSIFQMDDSEEVLNFLVLDELTAAPQSVQAAAYQITLDRQIGEHKLPSNCIVIAAGNKITDKSVSYTMPKALCNRLTHIEITPDVDDWKKWAINNDVDERIIAFINYKNDVLFDFDPSSSDNAYTTPRTWEMVSNYLKVADINTMRTMIEGTIGLGAATEFIAFTKCFNKLPNIDEIANGNYHDYPSNSEPDVYYALQAAIVNYCSKAKTTIKQIRNIIKYANDMQPEFAIITVKDLISIKNDSFTKVIMTDEWMAFANKYNEYL